MVATLERKEFIKQQKPFQAFGKRLSERYDTTRHSLHAFAAIEIEQLKQLFLSEELGNSVSINARTGIVRQANKLEKRIDLAGSETVLIYYANLPDVERIRVVRVAQDQRTEVRIDAKHAGSTSSSKIQYCEFALGEEGSGRNVIVEDTPRAALKIKLLRENIIEITQQA